MADLSDLWGVQGEDLTDGQTRGILAQIDLDITNLVRDGKLSALVGHSGVGKSSILYALDQSLQLATDELQGERGTGRHTPTAPTPGRRENQEGDGAPGEDLLHH